VDVVTVVGHVNGVAGRLVDGVVRVGTVLAGDQQALHGIGVNEVVVHVGRGASDSVVGGDAGVVAVDRVAGRDGRAFCLDAEAGVVIDDVLFEARRGAVAERGDAVAVVVDEIADDVVDVVGYGDAVA